MAEGKKIGRPRKKPGDPKSPYTMPQTGMTARAMENLGIKPYDGEDAEYNRRLIKHALEISALKPHRANQAAINLDDLKEAFIKYLELCDKNGIKPGTMGACCAMGIGHETLTVWKRGENPEKKEFAMAVTEVMGAIREGLIADGKLNPVIGIFWQRNFDRMRNDTEQVQSAQEAEERDGYSSYKEIKERYGELLKE